MKKTSITLWALDDPLPDRLIVFEDEWLMLSPFVYKNKADAEEALNLWFAQDGEKPKKIVKVEFSVKEVR